MFSGNQIMVNHGVSVHLALLSSGHSPGVSHSQGKYYLKIEINLVVCLQQSDIFNISYKTLQAVHLGLNTPHPLYISI